jgi:hypothetical protein
MREVTIIYVEERILWFNCISRKTKNIFQWDNRMAHIISDIIFPKTHFKIPKESQEWWLTLVIPDTCGADNGRRIAG